jgi:hypothetical protein
MSLIETVVQLAKPWADLYGHSKPLATIVTFAHIGGIMVGGGFAMASDRAALRAVKGSDDDRARVLADFGAIHRPVILSLVVVVLSGFLMMLADAETFLGSAVYYVKLGSFVALLANGWMVQQTEQALLKDRAAGNPRWGRFTLGARVSLTLWLWTALVGVALMNAA